MNSEFGTCLAVGAIWASSLSARELSHNVTVLLYNYAAVAAGDLAQAETEAARIYHYGGIEIEWLDCPLSSQQAAQFPACKILMGPTKLALRLLSRSLAGHLRQVQDSFGFALYPENGGFAMIANVFAQDSEELADRRGMRRGAVLGDIVAHELGHLLLGLGSHSRTGIMQAPWGDKELKRVAQGLITFAPAELERMRTNVSARMADEAHVASEIVRAGGQLQ